jgi:hypothetical protein
MGFGQTPDVPALRAGDVITVRRSFGWLDAKCDPLAPIVTCMPYRDGSAIDGIKHTNGAALGRPRLQKSGQAGSTTVTAVVVNTCLVLIFECMEQALDVVLDLLLRRAAIGCGSRIDNRSA